MKNEQYIQLLTAVINTLNGVTIRADQLEAIQRINACTRELRGLIEAIKAEPAEEEKN